MPPWVCITLVYASLRWYTSGYMPPYGGIPQGTCLPGCITGIMPPWVYNGYYASHGGYTTVYMPPMVGIQRCICLPVCHKRQLCLPVCHKRQLCLPWWVYTGVCLPWWVYTGVCLPVSLTSVMPPCVFNVSYASHGG